MGIIINILIQIAISLILSLLFSRPTNTYVKPAGFSDFDFPTASQSRPIPVIWGEQELKAPNLTWAGDFTVSPIKEKVKSLFSSKSITVGYKYYMGMQLALCNGGGSPTEQVHAVTRLRYGDKVAWEGNATHLDVTAVSNNGLYGGDKSGGGISGSFKLYAGTDDQVIDEYLIEQQGEYATAHVNVCHVIWYGGSRGQGYVANSSNLRTMWFTVQRYPNTLGLTGNKHIIGKGANPACMIYELLTNEEWGFGSQEGLFNKDDLTAMGNTLAEEGFGLGFTWDNERSIEDIISEILQHIGGYYYEDKLTGQLRFGLFRDDYDVNSLDLLERPTVLSVGEYSRTSYEGSVNNVSVAYSNPERFYELDLVTVNDLGNAYIQDKPVTRSNQYHGIVDKSIAVQAAWRDLRNLSLPLTRAVLTCNRSVSLWNVGKVFKWTEDSLGIDNLVMRVTKVERGDHTNQEVVIHCMEDVFSLGDAVFSTPTDGDWVPPTTEAVPLQIYREFEVPLGLAADQDLNSAELYVLVDPVSGFNLGYESVHGSTKAGMESYGDDGVSFTTATTTLTKLGHHVAGYDAAATLTTVGTAESPEEGAGASQDSMILIGTELICYDKYKQNNDGTITYTGLHRGMLNTVAQDHPVGSQVFYINGGAFIPSIGYSTSNIHYELTPFALSGDPDPVNALYSKYTVTNEKTKPYVAVDFVPSTETYQELFNVGENITMRWRHNPRTLNTGGITAGDANGTLEVDTTYKFSVELDSDVLVAKDIAVATGNSNRATGTITWAELNLTASTPPYLEFKLKAVEDVTTNESTYTATRVLTTTKSAKHDITDVGANAPAGEVVVFDGLHIGVRNDVT